VSGYPPIADHGLVGDLRTVALVDTAGTVGWLCCPRFDSPSVFGSLLDAGRGGGFRLAPHGEVTTTKQLYLPDTNVLITRFLTEDGVGEVQDFMPVAGDGGEHRSCLVRRVVVARGSMTFRLEVTPRFGYGRVAHVAERHPGGAVFRSASLSLALGTHLPLELRGGDAHARFALGEGQSTALTLECAGEGAWPRARSPEEISQLFNDTVSYWRSWLSRSRYTGRWREMVHRSALTLKLLTYQPTGAIIAAPTTSLPEQVGGERNWDYRYTWIRDAAFSAYALLRLGFTQEAAAFMQWLTLRFDKGGDHESGPLQIMYGIDGRAELPEETVQHWEGYAASAPVRVGNAAAGQLQLDIYGELIDAVYLYNKYGAPISHDGWVKVSQIIDWVCAHWDQPDEGVWEVRGGRRQFTYSRLMCWVAVERAVRIARQRGLPADIVRWMAVRDAIYRQIMERGWHPQRRAFVQHYNTDVLDASLLLMPLVKFIAPTDPRWLSTLDAISRELVSDSLVYRYNPQASPDGLHGHEGTFSICTFWYVEALTRAGRLDDARLALEKMFTYANHLGLYAEQIGRTGEQLGNFPQAFTHLALISAAWNLDRALGQRSR
jgi:GH15 family glucan-1,4-alpha-glucosidase